MIREREDLEALAKELTVRHTSVSQQRLQRLDTVYRWASRAVTTRYPLLEPCAHHQTTTADQFRPHEHYPGKAMHSMAGLLSASMACVLQDYGAGCQRCL